jgi:WD40 repeat protein
MPKHGEGVLDCAFFPDGSLVVSASRDQTLKIWDAMTGEERKTLHGHASPVWACAVSPDGFFIASGSWDSGFEANITGRHGKTFKVFDARTGEERTSPRGHNDGVLACAVSPDGSFIVSGSRDMTLKLWDAETTKERASLRGHTSPVVACAVSHDGSFIVSGSGDDTLKIWDTQTTNEHATLRGHTASVSACAVSPDGSYIVSASHDKTLKIWDAQTSKELASLVGHQDEVLTCAVSPDGLFIVSGSEDKTVKVWDARTEAEVVTIPILGPVQTVACHPWLPNVAIGVDDPVGTLTLMNLEHIEYGPIIVTSIDRGDGPTLQCPKCNRVHALDEEWLGQVIDCPTPACGFALRVNPSIMVPPSRRVKGWRRLFASG